jgi:hypothetical protein
MLTFSHAGLTSLRAPLPAMSAEAAALQQLRGLVAALGAGDAAALRDVTVTSLRAAANAVSRLARDASPELARGSWEMALELWCAALRKRALHCAARLAICTTLVDARATPARGPRWLTTRSARAAGTWLLR